MVNESASQLRLKYTAFRTQCSIKNPQRGRPGVEPEPRGKPSGLYQDLTRSMKKRVLKIWRSLTQQTNRAQKKCQ